jgi:rubrerythrin
MPTLFAELYDGEEDEDEDLYEKEDFDRADELDDFDIDADEDEILCLQCGEVIEDGVQCPVCGWVREYTKPILGDL